MSSHEHELEKRIIALHREGHKSRFIEAELQVGPKRVRGVLTKHGLTKPNPGVWTDQEIQTLYRLFVKEGMKVPKIVKSGQLPGRTTGSIRTRLSKCRIVNGRFEQVTADHVTDEYLQRKAEMEARIRALPKDTRGKTAVLMGDPIPQRSALAMKQQAEKVIPLRRAS